MPLIMFKPSSNYLTGSYKAVLNVWIIFVIYVSCLSSLYSKTCLKRPLNKKTKHGFQGRLSLNAGQKYCRMLPLEHSAIISTFIKLLFVIHIFVFSIFEWPL